MRAARLPFDPRIARGAIRHLSAQSQDIAEALWWEMMVSAEIQREWTVNLGCRTATERLAHLFCELAARLNIVGLGNAQDYDVPLTQADLGEMLGLSTVHVNRTLQDLRSMGVISFKGRRLAILDELALRRIAMFNPAGDRRLRRRLTYCSIALGDRSSSIVVNDSVMVSRATTLPGRRISNSSRSRSRAGSSSG